MLAPVIRVCRLVAAVIALAVLLQYALPGHVGAAMVVPDGHPSHLSIVAPASHDPLAPCADHEGLPAACCFGGGCTLTGVALPSTTLAPMMSRSAPGYAMPASEHRSGVARIPGLHPPRRAA